MSEQQIHQLILIVFIFAAMVFCVLLLLEPVMAVLWLFLVLLAVLLIAMRKPEVFAGEKRRFAALLARLKGDPEIDPAPDTDFHADHVLVEMNARGNIVHQVNKETYVIGRGSRCDCRVQAAEVSRQHCRIVYRRYSRMYFIEDMRSQKGTYLGTRRLEPNEQVRLLDDMEITVGPFRFQFVKRADR